MSNFLLDTSPCSIDNGGCEQLCFAYPNDTTAVCACATGNLATDNKTCEGILCEHIIFIVGGEYVANLLQHSKFRIFILSLIFS